MNKEEILEKSRKENKNKDVYEQEIIKQGNARCHCRDDDSCDHIFGHPDFYRRRD